MTSDDIIDALEGQKQLLEGQLADLIARCQTDAERATVRGSYQRAVQQWNDAVNQALRTNDPALAGLVVKLNDLQDEVADMIEQAADLASILDKIADGIGIGAKILTLVK